VLLPAVLIVWGLVAWRIYDGLNPEEENFQANFSSGSQTYFEAATDTFQLMANYSDPFLDRSLIKFGSKRPATGSTGQPQNQQKRPKPQQKPITQRKMQWPEVVYKGFIKNHGSGDQQAVLSVNNRENIMRQGDVFQSVELLAISKDSVEVRFGGEEKRLGL